MIIHTKEIIDGCIENLNIYYNTNIYTQKYLAKIFNSKDDNKINLLLNNIKCIITDYNFRILFYENNEINFNSVDYKFFKINDLDELYYHFDRFDDIKILGIFNKFIIENEEEIKSYFKKKILNPKFKLLIFKRRILMDFLIGMNIIQKPIKYKDIHFLPSELTKYINKFDFCSDIIFINETIQNIKNNTFVFTPKLINTLTRILNASTNKLFLKEPQICYILNALNKKNHIHQSFIDKLKQHGFIYAIDIMKEKFNINCYFDTDNIIKEDNGKLFEYLLTNKKINISNLTMKFIYNVLYQNKINIINVIIKYNCNLNEHLTILYTMKSTTNWQQRTRYNFLMIKDKTKFAKILALTEKMGFIVDENILFHIISNLLNTEIINYIEKLKLKISDIIELLVINKCWGVIDIIFNNDKYNYSKETYINNIYEILKRIKSKVSNSSLLEIYNYHMSKYKIKPPKILKNIAFFALNLNFIKKLVEKYNFKYTLDDINKYISLLKKKTYNLNYKNKSEKIHNFIININYLSNKFIEIKKIYESNVFYQNIKYICRIFDKTYLFMIKNNQIELNNKTINGIINIIILTSNISTFKYIYEKYKHKLDINKLLTIEINEVIFVFLINEIIKNKKQINQEIQEKMISNYFNGLINQYSLNYLINNKLITINEQIITLLVLETIYFYRSGIILINALKLYPFINYKTFEYIEFYIISKQYLKPMTGKRRFFSRDNIIIDIFTEIIDLKNKLTIIQKNNTPYKIMNLDFDIDESNLVNTQVKYNYFAEHNYTVDNINNAIDINSDNESNDEHIEIIKDKSESESESENETESENENESENESENENIEENLIIKDMIDYPKKGLIKIVD
jgi:hypothetical protein